MSLLVAAGAGRGRSAVGGDAARFAVRVRGAPVSRRGSLDHGKGSGRYRLAPACPARPCGGSAGGVLGPPILRSCRVPVSGPASSAPLDARPVPAGPEIRIRDEVFRSGDRQATETEHEDFFGPMGGPRRRRLLAAGVRPDRLSIGVTGVKSGLLRGGRKRNFAALRNSGPIGAAFVSGSDSPRTSDFGAGKGHPHKASVTL